VFSSKLTDQYQTARLSLEEISAQFGDHVQISLQDVQVAIEKDSGEDNGNAVHVDFANGIPEKD